MTFLKDEDGNMWSECPYCGLPLDMRDIKHFVTNEFGEYCHESCLNESD